MDGKFKQTIRLMWGHKQYRRVFGTHPVLVGCCVFFAIVGGLLPLIAKWAGEEGSGAEYLLSGVIPSFLYLIMHANLSNQNMVLVTSGKSLLTIPGAKEMLTKGLLFNRLVSLVTMLLPTVLLLHLCVWLGVCEKAMTDDVVIMFGIVYLLSAIAAGIPFAGSILSILMGISVIYNAMGERKLSSYIKIWLERAYAYDMPWWLVTILMILLLTVGTVFGVFILNKAYEKRRVAIPLEQRVAQQ